MCGISTIVGYGVQSDTFNLMMADLHEQQGVVERQDVVSMCRVVGVRFIYSQTIPQVVK